MKLLLALMTFLSAWHIWHNKQASAWWRVGSLRLAWERREDSGITSCSGALLMPGMAWHGRHLAEMRLEISMTRNKQCENVCNGRKMKAMYVYYVSLKMAKNVSVKS